MSKLGDAAATAVVDEKTALIGGSTTIDGANKDDVVDKAKNVAIPILAVICLVLGWSNFYSSNQARSVSKTSAFDVAFEAQQHVMYRPSCVYYGDRAEKVRIVQSSLGQPSQPWANLSCYHDTKTTIPTTSTFGAPDAVLQTNFSQIAHPDRKHPILGFGGAFTEAAALNYNSLSDKGKKKFIELLFGKSGLGYGLGRVHINSCDFSVKSYSFDDVDGDFELNNFDMDVTHDVKSGMVDLIKTGTEMYKLAWGDEDDEDDGYDGNLRLFGSPWSPPSWMKSPTWEDDSDAEHAEKMTYSAQPVCLREGVDANSRYAKAWALYFSKFLTAYKNQGIDFFSISVQNEPEFPAPWEACAYTPETEGDFVANHLGPRLKADHPDVKIAIFDHNKDHINKWTRKILNESNPAAQFVDGVAYHWYAGGMNRLLDGAVGAANMHRLQEDLRRLGQLENQLVIGIESCHCPSTGYCGGDSEVIWSRAERYAHTILADLAAGSNGWMEWNLLLDPLGGPNHLGNMCDAALLAAPNRAKDAPSNINISALPDFEEANYPFGIPVGDGRTREELNVLGFPAEHLDDGIIVQPIYYYMGHISRWVRPGSRAVMGLVDVNADLANDGNLPFRPKGSVVAGGGLNDLAQIGIELTAWPCEGSTRQEFKYIKDDNDNEGQIKVFGHDWLGKPTTSCVGRTPDEWFEGLLLESCEGPNYGSFDMVEVEEGGSLVHFVLTNGKINDKEDNEEECLVLRELQNNGGAYGPKGGAQITIGQCSNETALFSYDKETGEIASYYYATNDDDDDSSKVFSGPGKVCITTGWPFLQMGAYDTSLNGESDKTIVILNEAKDSANYALNDGDLIILTGSIPPRSIQTILLDS